MSTAARDRNVHVHAIFEKDDHNKWGCHVEKYV